MSVTIPVSTVPAAQAAILSAVETLLSGANETGVLVCVGAPGPNLPTDIIEIGAGVRRIVKPSSFTGSGGPGSLEEAYDISVSISSARAAPTPTKDPTRVVQRAWQLVAYLETAVRRDPSLGTVVLEAYPGASTGGRATWSENGVGRICTLIVPIHCEAVI